MIVFLTLIYIGLLALLLKLGVIKLNLWWKISPALWMVFLLVVLFIPMQWGAPAGTVNAYRFIIEVVPNVSGEVTSVPVQPLVPLEAGDTLFTIDRIPFEAEVHRLQAALAEAKQDAKILEAELDRASEQVKQLQVRKVEAEQQVAGLDAALEAAKATVAKTRAQSVLAKQLLERTRGLLDTQAVTEEEFEEKQAAYDESQAAYDEAVAHEKQAQLAVDSKVGDTNTLVATVEAQLREARAAEAKAKLATESTINGENTLVAQLEAQLERANFDLEQTVVRAPSDGYVVAVSLRPGQRVSNLPLRSWMPFVSSQESRLIVGLHQNVLRHVESGQAAEVTLKVRPGHVYQASVEKVIPINMEGQVQASGLLPDVPNSDQQALNYGVILKLEDSLQLSDVQGGANGTAAIYTKNAKATHIIRRVMIRMEAWMNYIIP